MNFDFNNDDIFAGNPKDTFFDIVYNANRNLVELEIEDLVEKLLICEELLKEATGISDEEVEKRVLSYKHSNMDKLETLKMNEFIHLTGSIVTKNE